MKRIYKVVTHIFLSARQPRFVYGMPLVAALLAILLNVIETLPANSIAFQDSNAKVSYIYSESVYCADCGYAIQVSKTQMESTGS